MPRTRPPYSPEFRQQMVELVKAGRTPEELSREFEPTAQTIHNWVKQSDRDAGVRSDGLTSSEREELRNLRRENKRLRVEREILKSRGLVRSGVRLSAPEAFEFVRANQAEFSVRLMCEVLSVSPSGYYAWRKRPPSRRLVENERLLNRIREIHTFSRDTYGQPRMYAELRDDGWQVNHKRIRHLMRLDGLQGATRRKKWRTTKRAKDARPAPDLVERDFSVDGPNQLWVADITYVPTWSSFLYLSVVVDAWSRRVVGWSMKTHLKTDLVLDALNMALQQRRPSGVIHHSDQGTHDPLNLGSTPRSPSAYAARRPASGPRWVPLAMPMTTRCARASSQHSRPNSSSVRAFVIRLRPGWLCSTSSRPGTIPTDGTPPSVRCPLSTTKRSTPPPLESLVQNRPPNGANSRANSI